MDNFESDNHKVVTIDHSIDNFVYCKWKQISLEVILEIATLSAQIWVFAHKLAKYDKLHTLYVYVNTTQNVSHCKHV